MPRAHRPNTPWTYCSDIPWAHCSDVLRSLVRHLVMKEVGWLACSQRLADPGPLHEIQATWMADAAAGFLAGRRLAAMGILAEGQVQEMWHKGAWRMENRWTLQLDGTVEGEDLGAVARSLARLARAQGAARRRAKGRIYYLKWSDRQTDAARYVRIQIWCEVDCRLRALHRAPDDADALAAAGYAVYRLVALHRALEALAVQYIPRILGEFAWTPRARRALNTAFAYLDRRFANCGVATRIANIR